MKTFTTLVDEKKNPPLYHYLKMYKDIEKSTIEHIEQFGVPFGKNNGDVEKVKLIDQLNKQSVLFRNNNKSIVTNGKISSACVACQTGTGSYTSFISLKCHRNCYFCFNKNQDNYSYFSKYKKNVIDELISLKKKRMKITHVALTGGEPLLHPEETIQFFQTAKKLYPNVHSRLYTAGDFVNEKILQQLKTAGLDEIRFSLKMEDPEAKRNKILKKIALANEYIEDTLVEMPVIPGTEKEMKELLLELDRIGIFGINLLEFCFPLENSQSFNKRNFKLKNPPYEVYYNFWYAGGLAVDESEILCLKFLNFAVENNLKIGVHYCSLENKFTGQIYQQNHDQDLDETYTFSNNDYYFKTAKVFGKKDIELVKQVLQNNQISYVENNDYDFIQFSIQSIPLLTDEVIDVVISSNVVEQQGDDQVIREVKVELIDTRQFKFDEI